MEEHTFSEVLATNHRISPLKPVAFRFIYLLAALVSIATWFLTYKSPLWLDETVSYWEISGGFAQIWRRSIEGLSFPAYSYLLWAIREMFGSREVVLRIPSVLAMLASVFVLYRIARQFFDEDIALLVCILFCLHKDVAFAAIDVRPYAFAVLATNLAIYTLIGWVREPKTSHSILLGALCGFIFYFQYLYAVILPAFLAYYLLLKGRSIGKELKQILLVAASFAVVSLPVIPRLLYIISRRNTYSFAVPPTRTQFLFAFLPTAAPFVWVAAVVAAIGLSKLYLRHLQIRQPFLLPLLLAVIPTALLYGISVNTPIRIFLDRYWLVGVMGMVLLWGVLVAVVSSVPLRLMLCIVYVPWAIFSYCSSPDAHHHLYTWKPALEYADRVARTDQAPLLICSDLPQADFETMPSGPQVDSVLFAPLSYYKVSVPVVPLPRTLNEEAKLIGRRFFSEAAARHERFLALGFRASYPTLRWLMSLSSATYVTHDLGDFDGVAVIEFDPLGDVTRVSELLQSPMAEKHHPGGTRPPNIFSYGLFEPPPLSITD
jgi:hypothetical protein